MLNIVGDEQHEHQNDAGDVQATFCATLVDEWVAQGLTDAVVSPGSRSTPLVNALADDGRMILHVVLDERGAGFLALGIGMASGMPAPVVTTSGTAAVELHPAMVEAAHAQVPMIAVTADRPPELHGVGAPQTIEQHGLFGSVVRWSAEPGVADAAAAGSWRSLAARSVLEAVSGPTGPGVVHLNLAFRDPLVAVAGATPARRPATAGGGWHRSVAAAAAVPRELIETLARHRNGIIVAGPGTPAATGARQGASGGPGEDLRSLATLLGWPLIADPLSGARLPGPNIVAAADALLRCPQISQLVPEVVLRFGRPSTSKVLSSWLAGLPGSVEQILVDPTGSWADPERSARTLVISDPAAVLQGLVDHLAPGSAAPAKLDGSQAWSEKWLAAEAAAQSALSELVEADSGLSEPAVARVVVQSMADHGNLITASSMPVRDVEWFSSPRPAITFMANRGANGIDGTIATALGVGLATHRPTTCLIGDLSFCYDAGALLGWRRRDVDCTVVIVDNRGGGIFSFLPQAGLGRTRFETFWGTPPDIDVADLARAYGVAVDEVGDVADLRSCLSDKGRSRVRVVVARTDRSENVGQHQRWNNAVGEAVKALSKAAL